MDKQAWEMDADNFINNETPFHLGFLVTESSHPYTIAFSETIHENTGKGVSQLLSVDTDISKAFQDCIKNPGLKKLMEAVINSVIHGKRIIFSGCGSTGRLSILLESMWRKGCLREASRIEEDKTNQELVGHFRRSANNVRGIITGGDRALIKSVENFEDYQEFGRQQVRELNLQPEDVFIAISEGGETSSVIGTAHEANSKRCKTFFIFNNPADLLCKNIERSRKLIEDTKVTSIDLSTGPMAISGSTRMQATTMELLAIGSVLEIALMNILNKAETVNDYTLKSLKDYSTSFDELLKTLQNDQSNKSLISIIELEKHIYLNKGMIIYTINDFLLDIFTDTTERTPTFSTPPLKSIHSKETPSPWAVALQTDRGTKDTWIEMIGREPIGLNWNSTLYDKLDSPELALNPPRLGIEEIYTYKIGSEGFEFYNDNELTHIEIIVLDSVSRKTITKKSTNTNKQNFIPVQYQLIISDDKEDTLVPGSNILKLAIPATPLRLFTHIAAKLVFNTISTATMARLGRIEGNWMVEVTPSNKKLIDRSIRIISELRSISYKESAYLVFKEIYNNPDDLSSLVARLL
jgi:N-acetylmuramic acid 6-phosphate etherase